MNCANWPIVIVESPYAGDIETNLAYARKACAHCILQGEIPYASHLFFTQFLDDKEPTERETGLTAGYAFWRQANKVVFYVDRGMSPGMQRARMRAVSIGMPWETRSIEGDQ